MNGILVVLKPSGMTSFDVVSYLKGLLKTKKIGHTGTLDPLAAGVLPVCLGKATKAVETMMESNKEYRAELTLGISTDTQDSDGSILSQNTVNVSDPEIETVFESFEGGYFQLPPMYSALKINGKKLYELAREGTTVDREKRRVELKNIEVVDIDRSMGKTKVMFNVKCSKGTYIRTLCSDIGDALGCGGHMSFLLRKSAAGFNLDDAFTLEEIKSKVIEGKIEDLIIGIDKVFGHLGKIVLTTKEEASLLNGIRVLCNEDCTPGQKRLYDSSGSFFALGEVYISNDHLMIASKKFFK